MCVCVKVPEMGVPLNHQFYFWVFQYKPSIFGDSPCMKTLILQIY